MNECVFTYIEVVYRQQCFITVLFLLTVQLVLPKNPNHGAPCIISESGLRRPMSMRRKVVTESYCLTLSVCGCDGS